MTVITTEPETQGKVVVGYDGSAGSVSALTYAARLANDRGHTLLILMALPHLDPKIPRTARALKLDPDYLTHIKTRAKRFFSRCALTHTSRQRSISANTFSRFPRPAR